MEAKPKILLVDDESRFIDSLSRILSHYEYDCNLALSGKEALMRLEETHFEVALLDIGLPDMSGCDIVSFISENGINTTAVMLTGQNTVETAVHSMKLGAYDFLKKPINHDLLIKTLDKAINHNRLKQKVVSHERRFQVLAEAAWECIVIHRNTKIVEVNSRFSEMFGYHSDDIESGLTLEHIFTPKSLSFLRDSVANMELKNFEIAGLRKNKSEFRIEAKARNLDYFGGPAQVLVLRDITKRVLAEQEKLALQQKLAVANKLKALGLMAGSVAHDLNNILTAVVSYPELLLMQMNSSDKYYKEIKKMQEAGRRAAAVVSDLVSIARGGVKSMTVENLNDIVTSHLNSIEHCERLAKYPGVRVRTTLDRNLYDTCCSSQYIHKILLNLIGNALEAVGGDGEVHIETSNSMYELSLDGENVFSHEEVYVKLSISDDGPGISAIDKEHIFDPFYSTKKMGKSGTGLGLAVVWNSVREHNGWVDVHDNNPGAKFDIWLPANRQRRDSKHKHCSLPSHNGKGETILLVDDEPDQNEIMHKMLSTLGYKTLSVTCGEDAIDVIKDKQISLVVLDMIIGEGLNGRETFEKMLEINPYQKAIIVSGYARQDEVVKAKELGVEFFLEKPVTLPQISQTVSLALQKTTLPRLQSTL